jgi:hypothetical protein
MRSVKRKRLCKMTGSKWVRRPAGWIDSVVKERMPALTGRWSHFAIAAVCTALAVASPLTEFVPLSSAGVGVGILAFGVSLIARDGVVALIGFALSAATLVLAIMSAK